MANRKTDTSIWKRQRWFRKLSTDYKLAFLYIKDQCDYAGLWKIDVMELLEDTGIESFDLQNFVEQVNTEFDKLTGQKEFRERLIFADDDILVITGFMNFQYSTKTGGISPNHMIASHAISILRAHGLLDLFIERNYAIFSSELPEHRAKKIAKQKGKSKKKLELDEQTSYLNIIENVEQWEDRIAEETKIKRLEIMRDEMKASSTLELGVRQTVGLPDDQPIDELVDGFCDYILGTGHHLKGFKEVKSYFINKLNYAKQQMKEKQNGKKVTGADKQIEALKQYIQ